MDKLDGIDPVPLIGLCESEGCGDRGARLRLGGEDGSGVVRTQTDLDPFPSIRLGTRAMQRPWRLAWIAAFALVGGPAWGGPPIADPNERLGPASVAEDLDDAESTGTGLSMTRAIVCESVTGYGDFVERPDARLTADEKLVIYFEPRRFASERVKQQYQVHLSQDARLRRHGAKAVIQVKEKILDLPAKSRDPIGILYMSNTISVSELRPGDYDLDIILHDVLGGGDPARQVVRFTIVPEEEGRRR